MGTSLLVKFFSHVIVTVMLNQFIFITSSLVIVPQSQNEIQINESENCITGNKSRAFTFFATKLNYRTDLRAG